MDFDLLVLKQKICKACADDVVGLLLSLLKDLRLSRQERWFAMQKPFGFESINENYGRAIAQMEYTQARLDGFLCGKFDVLEELETANAGYLYANPMKLNFDKI